MNDVMIRIFGYLNIADRFTVRQVSREWRQLVNSPSLRRPEMTNLEINFVSYEDFAEVKFHGNTFEIRFPSISQSQITFDTKSADYVNNRNQNLDNELCHQMGNLLNRYGRYVDEIRLCKTKSQKIPIEADDFPFYAEISPRFLKLIVTYCRSVHTMTFKRVTFKVGTLDVLTGDNFPNLKVLRLNDVDWNNVEDELIRFMISAPKVEQLNFRWTSAELLKALTLNNVVRHLKILVGELQFANGLHIDTEVVESVNKSLNVELILFIQEYTSLASQFLYSLNTVTKLDIRMWTNKNLRQLCNAVASLKDTLEEFLLTGFESILRIGMYTLIDDDVFPRLTDSLQQCKKMKLCSLVRCCRSVENFQPLLSLDFLEKFLVNGAPHLQIASLKQFVITSPKLRTLAIRNCPRIGSDEIVEIFNSSKTLEEVEFAYCGHLSQSVGECLSYIRSNGWNLQLCHMKGTGILEWDDNVKSKLLSVYQEVDIKGRMYWEDENVGTLMLCSYKMQSSHWQNVVEGGIMRLIECCNYC